MVTCSKQKQGGLGASESAASIDLDSIPEARRIASGSPDLSDEEPGEIIHRCNPVELQPQEVWEADAPYLTWQMV